MTYLKSFSVLSKNDAAIAGGKGASLGEMTRAGIPVPPGFVVLASTFDKFLELAGIDADIDAIISKVNHQEIHTVEQASKEIQAIILNSSIPKEIEIEIRTAFKKLKTKYVAVRSSATAEDSSSAAWAGQLDSFLNTNEENLLDNVKKCWASLFTPRAIFYRFEKELHNQKISVAVVIQKMVESEVSGIAFSVHPVTEDYNQIIIEAGFGLGEAIVSGQITPDSYVITKDDFKIIDKNIYTQERGIYRSKDNMSNDWVNIQNKKGSSQCLSDEQILELSKLIIRIENHYGFPCDIEWAMEGGEFFIVQSRPITTLKNNYISSDGKNNPVVLSKWCSREYSLLQIVQYCQLILENKENTEYSMDHELFFYNSKIKMVEVYHSLPELDGLFKSIGGLARDPMFVKEIIADFKQSLNELIPYFEGRKKTKNIVEFLLLYNLFFKFYRGNSYVWVLPLLNFLPEVDRKMAMACRKATEKYSSDRDMVLINNLKILFPHLGDLVRFLLPEEIFEGSIDDSLLEKLEKRSLGFVYYRNQIHQSSEISDFFHSHNLEMEKFDFSDKSNEIKGVTAQKGAARGRVKLVFISSDLGKVENGDIIISPMTRPEFLPTMKKALAFVTDEGGITCHAAIVAREMSKPCIIGTKIATQILKDGDEVEVDADNGIVRILNRNNEPLVDVKKFKETTKDRVYISQQGDISIALLGNICNTIQDKYVSVYGYNHVRPILTLQKRSQGVCYFDLEMYRDFSRVSYSRIKKSVYDLPEYKDYKEISKIIDSEYGNFFIPKTINEAKEKISYYFELAKIYLASTLFCEAVDHQIVNELVKNLEVKNINEFIETSILPTKPSFVNHQNQLLLDNKDISWSFTNYFASPDKAKRLKLVEKKRSELLVKETKEEIEKNEKAAQFNQTLVDALIKKSSPEQKKLIEFIQTSINMRDERKEFILKLFTILSDSLRNLAKELNISYDAISTIVDIEIDKLEDSLFLETLKERSEKGAVMISYNDGPKVETIDYDFVRSIIFDESIEGNNLEGICANKGNYVGLVRIIISGKDFHQFKEGEILVTGMTRAEYVPLMRKAGAIITDEGGVTCHAAIISRELGKPCVINTRIATQVLKNGDEIEVDADNGVVRILRKVIEVKNIFDKSIDDYKIQAEGGRAVCYLLDHIMINQYLVENKTWPLIDINVFSSSIEHSAKWFRLHKGQLQYKEALDRFIDKPQLVDELFTYLKSNRDETIRLLNEKEYSKLSNQELADFFGYIISCYYKVLRPSSIIRLIDLGLINKLKEMFADRDDSNKYLTVSTASEEKSFVLNEEIALLELALEVAEKKLDTENKYVLDKLDNIFNEYCFSELGYYNEKIKTLDEYKKKLLEDVKSSPKERLAKINEDFKAFIEQREALVKGLSIEEKTVVDIASRLAHVKDVYKLSMNKVLYSSDKLFFEIAKRTDRSVEYIKDLSPDEIKSLLTGESINEAYIAKRLDSRVVIGFEKTLYVLTGEDATNFKNKYLEIDKSGNNYHGRCASSGHVSGKARIILSPKDFHKMVQGEILVVMNTSPDFTPIMKKAQAIIAEEGGLTAHVSIVSRELGIPSVVGVSHITEILKDGDEVEVDANNGVVRIIKPAK